MDKSVYTQVIEYIVGNQNKFYRLAYSYTKNKDSSLDIVQNAICKALENYQSIRNIKYIKTWFYRVLVNECLAYIKKEEREVVCEPDQIKESVYIEQAFEQDMEVFDKVDQLSEEIKTVIMLHYYQEMTLKEVAQITNTNLNTVKSRLYSGLKKLKIAMKEEAL